MGSCFWGINQKANMYCKLVFILLSCIASCYGGLLGAGQGGGSCAAAPFRTPAGALQWPNGCPAGNECCTEYGYCHPQSAWIAKAFRDCNGVSNGLPYPSDVIQAEGAAAAQGDTRGLALLSAAGASTSTGYGAVATGYGAATYAGLNGASGYSAYGNTAGYGSGGAGYGVAGSGAAGYAAGATGFGVAGAFGAGLVSFPNGAIVPADTADVAAAKFEHLKAHSYA